jgi:hypothetical protein
MRMDALDACRYLIARVRAKSGARWRQGLRHPVLPCTSNAAEARLVAERRLCGVPEPAARALSGWVAGRRPAVALDHAPTPRELLAMAARGRRPVSLLEADDGLAFLLHDLCHLEKFADPVHHRGQIGLFTLLDRVIDGPAWAELEANLDDKWRADRDHVLADMNGSPVYLYLVLEARLVEACTRCRADADERTRQLAALLAVRDRDRAAMATYFASVDAPARGNPKLPH